LLPPQDAFVPPRDAFMPPRDAFMPPRDAFVLPRDAFVLPRDAFMPPRDALMPPRDAFMPRRMTLCLAGRLYASLDTFGAVRGIITCVFSDTGIAHPASLASSGTSSRAKTRAGPIGRSLGAPPDQASCDLHRPVRATWPNAIMTSSDDE